MIGNVVIIIVAYFTVVEVTMELRTLAGIFAVMLVAELSEITL